ncbi:MAG: PAS domain-containing sensor histidine kinase [Flavobacteriaceae bacterium]|nr:PAS domain-containing sensor histidine kinase [Flavobacteriaceae bacterium]
MLKKIANIIDRLALGKYTNDLLFAIILFIASFTAITTIIRTQERSLESDLKLKSALIKDAVINQSKLNFLLNDSIGFLDLHNQIYETSDNIIEASFYDINGDLIWGHLEDNPSNKIFEIPEGKDFMGLEGYIYLKFPVLDNTDEPLGDIQFKCSTKQITGEITSLKIRLFVLSSILIITLLAISLWARSKLLSLTRSQAFTTARVELTEKNNSRLANIIENLPRGIAFENKQGYIAHLNQKFLDLLGIDTKIKDVLGLHCNQACAMFASVFPESERFEERTIEIVNNRKIVTDDTLKLLDGRSLTRHYAPVYEDGAFIGNLWAYADNTIETRFYENLSFEREKYMNIIANMEIGLLEVDNDDQILTANNAFLKMTKYTEEDLIGKIGYEILVSEKEAERIKKMNATRIEGESSIYEIEYLTKDGEVRHMMVSGGPNRDIKGNVIGSIGIHLDITKLKELEKLREELIKDLTESNDELSNYAHVVSHDLKTPLRSISAAMSWLKEDNKDSLDEMSQSYLEIVDEALLKMDKIISDTLRYSEIKRKTNTDSNVDLNHITGHLINELKQSYPETKIEINGTLPILTINETKIMQVFQNILDNACKYSDPSKKSRVKISCSLIFGFFEFAIEDNGIGIPEEHAHHVFEIFRKLNNNEGSNGVGMSIVKKIIDSYGGKIWFESEVGKGTIFKFNLPRSLRSATTV